MKAHKTTIQLISPRGYKYQPETFGSERKALEHARNMIKTGYAFSYKILKEEKGE